MVDSLPSHERAPHQWFLQTSPKYFLTLAPHFGRCKSWIPVEDSNPRFQRPERCVLPLDERGMWRERQGLEPWYTVLETRCASHYTTSAS